MKHKGKILSLWALAAFLVLIALTLTTATYAWFTANRQVQTDRITGKTGSADVTLEISRTREPFSPGKAKDDSGNDISQVALKTPDAEDKLMPVSTADLSHFWSSPTFDGSGQTTGFVLDETGEYYYHDTVYLRASGTGTDAAAGLALYLNGDAQKNPIVRSEDGKLLTAARLGLAFEGQSPRILRLSNVDAGSGVTYLNGKRLERGQVLGYAAGEPAAAADPSESLDSLRFDGANPEKTPLLTMELNKIYQLDIYFYLEGCDPDCLNETVGMTDAYLSLAFFGMLRQ